MARPSLNELRMALEVEATGNFREAARRLDVAPSTLSHAITGLERTIGLRLFHRTTRSVAPTLEGQAFLGRIRPLVSELDAAIAAPTSDPSLVGGALRINTPLSAGVWLLETIVPDFLAAYPSVELELRHEERLVDIVAQGCDAGIRLGRTVPGDMIGVTFGGSLNWALVAAPAYLEQHGVPTHPRELADHRCLRIRMPNGDRYAWEFVRDGEEFVLDVPGPMTVDRMALSIEAATQGLGIAYVLRQAIETRIAAGVLVEVLSCWMPDEDGYMLYYPGRRSVPPALRAFVDFVRGRRPSQSGGHRSDGALSR